MGICVNLDVMMAKRKVSAGDLAAKIGLTPANLSILKNNHAKAIRFSTLEAICKAWDCQPGDILEDRTEGSGGKRWRSSCLDQRTGQSRPSPAPRRR